MILAELIKEVISKMPEDKNVEITFEVGLMSDGRTINDCSKNRIKFTITNRK